jgi:hypothetical protein
MAEKNTLSILESIKQKMAKFDEKSQKSITAFDNEFDYSASEENNSNSQNVEKTITKNNIDLHDVVEEGDHNQNNNDDFLFDEDEDFDLEDDSKDKKEEISEMQDNDDEDFIINKGNDLKKPIVTESKKEEENFDDDFDMDFDDDEEDEGIDLDIEDDNHQQAPIQQNTKVESKKEINDEVDDLDVDFEEFEDEEEPKMVKAIEKKSFVEEEFEDDDDFEEEAEKHSDEEEDSQEEIEEENFDEDEEDDDEFEFEEERKAKELEKKLFTAENKVSTNQSEDDDIDEIDLDIEDEVLEKNNANFDSKSFSSSNNVNIKTNSLEENVISAIPSRKSPAVSRPLINEETLQQTTKSIKKLIDANNIVQGIKGFTDQNDSSLSELAVQLMDARLERWLNEHLPDLVEKIVREEIKKIISKE